MSQFSLAKLFGMTVRESANDGSDFTNPDADYRRLFLGEDGQLHVKDSAGAVTDIGTSGGDITTDTAWAAKGDLIAGTANDTAAILTVGSNGKVLSANSAQSTGLEWVTPSAGGSGLLAVMSYSPSNTDTTISSTTQADVDATNLIITFTAPASGNVLVTLQCNCYAENVNAQLQWGLRESSSDIAGPVTIIADGPTGPNVVVTRSFYLTGVSGGSHTYKWAASRVTANANMRYGATTYGPAIMTVWSAP